MTELTTFLVLALQESNPVLGAQPEIEVPGTPASGSQQPSGAAPAGDPARSTGRSPYDPTFLIILVVMMMILMMTMGGRKERRRRTAMLSALKKHDRVQTSGGIIGTITEIKDDELILRVDEGSNTRIRFARAAVVSVIRAAAGRDEADSKADTHDAEKANA